MAKHNLKRLPTTKKAKRKSSPGTKKISRKRKASKTSNRPRSPVKRK